MNQEIIKSRSRRSLYLAFLLAAPFIYVLVVGFSSGLFIDHAKYFKIEKDYQVRFVDKRPKQWLKIRSLPKQSYWTILLSEDWAFYSHWGLDLSQLSIVFENFFASGEFSRGASTITQQVLKNLYFGRSRSYLRKLNEFIFAPILEILLTKNQILERYLNLIELGQNIYGLEQGARYYFQKSARSLNYRESAFLAMLLPSPIKYSQSYRDKKLTPFAREQLSSILDKLVLGKMITEEEADLYKMQSFSWETGGNETFEEDTVDINEDVI